MSQALPLGPWDLAAASSLVLLLGATSVVLRLGLERKLAVASVRTVAQLLLIGAILKEVFALDSPWAVLAVSTVMVALAGRAATDRLTRTFSGATLESTASLALVGAATAILGSAGIIGAEPWWRPQYLIPLLGMLLGNSLTGVSLCVDSLLEALDSGQSKVEAALSLGATRWEAARQPVAAAVARGLVPILNSMTVVGIVALPGMMTGQILAGADPLEAVQYQIVIMFLIAAATTLGALSVALLAYRALFNARHQLRVDRIVRR